MEVNYHLFIRALSIVRHPITARPQQFETEKLLSV